MRPVPHGVGQPVPIPPESYTESDDSSNDSSTIPEPKQNAPNYPDFLSS